LTSLRLNFSGDQITDAGLTKISEQLSTLTNLTSVMSDVSWYTIQNISTILDCDY